MSAPRLLAVLSALGLALIQPASAALMVQPSVDPARYAPLHPHPLVPSSWDSSPMAVVGESQMWDPTGEGCVDGGSWEDPFPGGKGDVRAPAFCVARPCLRMLSPDELARDVFGRALDPGEWPVYLSRYRNSCLSDDPDSPVMVASSQDFDDLLGVPSATPAVVLLTSNNGWIAPSAQGWTAISLAAAPNPRNVAGGTSWPAPGGGLTTFLNGIGSGGGGGSSPDPNAIAGAPAAEAASAFLPAAVLAARVPAEARAPARATVPAVLLAAALAVAVAVAAALAAPVAVPVAPVAAPAAAAVLAAPEAPVAERAAAPAAPVAPVAERAAAPAVGVPAALVEAAALAVPVAAEDPVDLAAAAAVLVALLAAPAAVRMVATAAVAMAAAAVRMAAMAAAVAAAAMAAVAATAAAAMAVAVVVATCRPCLCLRPCRSWGLAS